LNDDVDNDDDTSLIFDAKHEKRTNFYQKSVKLQCLVEENSLFKKTNQKVNQRSKLKTLKNFKLDLRFPPLYDQNVV
jgi:hypothetical protein